MLFLHTTQNSSLWSHTLPVSWGGTEHAQDDGLFASFHNPEAPHSSPLKVPFIKQSY